MLKKFDCMEESKMKEYVRCKMISSREVIEDDEQLLIQSFEDECNITGDHHLVTQAKS